MDTTPNRGYAIPSIDDTDLMDADLWRTPLIKVDVDVKNHEDRLDVLDTTTPVADSDEIVAVAGWTIDTQSLIRVGRICVASFRVTRTGAAIPSTSDGNIANIGIANITGVRFRPMVSVAAAHTGEFGFSASVYINAAGLIGVGALQPGIAWGTGDSATFSATYIPQGT